MRRTAGGRRGGARVPPEDLRLRELLGHAAAMREPLELALGLTRGIDLVAIGLDDKDNARSLSALGRLIDAQLRQVQSSLSALLKVDAGRTPPR